jgi:CRP-like cAMP-binding protein
MNQVRSYLETLMAVDDNPLRFAAGDFLFKEGEPGREMYVVRTGTVVLRRHGRTLEEVGPGGVVGEMALIDSSPRSASAVAGDGCCVTAINEYTLLELVRKVPGLSLEIMRIMAGRLRRANAAPETTAPPGGSRPRKRTRSTAAQQAARKPTARAKSRNKKK